MSLRRESLLVMVSVSPHMPPDILSTEVSMVLAIQKAVCGKEIKHVSVFKKTNMLKMTS